MTKIKLKLKEIEIKDLNGKSYSKGLEKSVGNLLFTLAQDLEMDALARAIHKEEDAQATAEQIDFIVNAVSSANLYLPFTVRAIVNHLQKLKK